jgi:5-formyltetrahydrofolate cyclo-ligase
MMSNNPSKQTIRQTCLTRRKALSIDDVQNASQSIISALMGLEVYKTARHISLYYPYRGEIDVALMLSRMRDKIPYFPVIQPDFTLLFLPVDEQTAFEPNRYGILEPVVDLSLAISPNQLDLIILPVVAFDSACHRIGMGAGYYDRTLSAAYHPTLLGVAYDFQEQAEIISEPFDIQLDGILTETRLFWRGGCRNIG